MGEKAEQVRAMIGLNMIPGLGSRRIRLLLDHFRHPAEIFKADKAELMSLDGIGSSSALAIRTFEEWSEADKQIRMAERSDIEMMLLTDSDYPVLLRQIFDPPPILWIRGDREVLSSKGLAVVGTRDPSLYGKNTALKFARTLSEQGLCIYSGLAYGIDTIAHHGALEGGGKTVAVLGSGLDKVYPGRNRLLAKKIVDQGGAVITEFPFGTDPDAGNFPVRNRIVSGLSLGVIVIESGLQGGSMITADLALDQNREVFAVPHPVHQPGGMGCNYLIKTGAAKLVQDLSDIIEEMPAGTVANVTNGESLRVKQPKKWEEIVADPFQIRICKLLTSSSMQIDDMAEQLDTDTGKLLVALLDLEMKEVVVQRAGKKFEIL